MTMTILSIAMAVALAGEPTQARAPAPTAQQQQRRISERRVRFNQKVLSAAELRTLEQLEVAYRFRLPNGDYWYDPVSGAAGAWGGPTVGFFPAGLQLGGKLPANASGGGTRVFVNGRELHPLDVAQLSQLGPVYPGRYFVDRFGNVGYEGGPVLFNLIAVARAASSRGNRSGGAWGHTFSDGSGRNNYVGGDSHFGYVMDSKGNSFYYDK
jgi:hypothetical protein